MREADEQADVPPCSRQPSLVDMLEMALDMLEELVNEDNGTLSHMFLLHYGREAVKKERHLRGEP